MIGWRAALAAVHVLTIAILIWLIRTIGAEQNSINETLMRRVAYLERKAGIVPDIVPTAPKKKGEITL